MHVVTLGLITLAAGLIAAVPGLHGVARRLSHARPGWIVLAFALEVLSGLCSVLAFQRCSLACPGAPPAAWPGPSRRSRRFPTAGAGGSAVPSEPGPGS